MNYNEFKNLSIRTDSSANNKTFFFSNRFSNIIAYAFFKIKISPNFATWIFFFCGISSTYFFWIKFYLIGYLFWRMHIIIDMVDGILARASNKFSKSAEGFDRSAHIAINTSLIFVLTPHDQNIYLIMMLLISFYLYSFFSINYYTIKQQTRSLKFVYVIMRNLMTLEGFILLNIFLSFFYLDHYRYYLTTIYSIFFFSIYVKKLQLFLKNN